MNPLAESKGGAGPFEAPPERRGVPFLDLSHQNAPIRDEVLAEIGTLIDSGAFTNGPQVKRFEAAFAAFCGTTECVGVASGLDALRLALLAADVGAGDEVIVPAATFVATAEAVTQVGARPVLVDAAADYTLDPDAVEAALTPRTRAISPVHLYGQMADMARIQEIAARHSVAVVEDACQAHGATRDGLRAGAVGSAGAFSFYPAKNLGAFGDAGALTTNDPELANRVRALREHGGREKYQHEFPGYTARLDTLQALVLLRKLESSRDGTRSGGGLPPCTTRGSPESATSCFPGCRAGASPCGTSTSCAPPAASRSRASSPNAASGPASTTPSRCT